MTDQPSDRAARVEREDKPPLIAYMEAKTTPERDAAFLRLYAEKVLNRTEVLWETPNTRASTLNDIALRLAAQDARLVACQEKRDAYKAASIKAVDVAILLTDKLEAAEAVAQSLREQSSLWEGQALAGQQRISVLEAALREIREAREALAVEERRIFGDVIIEHAGRGGAQLQRVLDLTAALSASPERP